MAEAMRQRLYDLALMRCFGAAPFKLLRLVLLEGLIISLAGGALGLLASRYAAAYASGQILGGQLSIGGAALGATDGWLLLGVVALGLVGSLIPALRIYRIGIPALLASR
jgi:putative ABC transport system permease protein